MNALNSDNLQMLIAVDEQGSLAGAARSLGVVPSALTYRMRKLEEELDALLLDRSSRSGQLTLAGQMLAREGRRLLLDAQGVAQRVKAVASGWEPKLTIALDSIVNERTVLDLCDQFYKPFGSAASCPTEIRLRAETLSGTFEALVDGQADLAIGVVVDGSNQVGILSAPLGEVPFVFAVAPHHPLAAHQGILSDASVLAHRAVAVADSTRRGQAITVGLLDGQDVLTVPSMSLKLEAQLRGLGCGFVPEALARPYLESGRLVAKKIQRRSRVSRVSYAWRPAATSLGLGLALQWWLAALEKPRTRRALLGL